MLSKRELYNARNAGNKIEKGMKLNVVAVGTFDDTDKDGKPVKVSALKTDEGSIFTTISATISDSLDDLDEIITEEGTVTVEVLQNKSNNGREFFQLQIL